LSLGVFVVASLVPALMGSSKMIRVLSLSVLCTLFLATTAGAQSAAELRELGLSYRDQERYPEAIAALQQAIQLEPQNLSGRVLLGWTQHRAGQETDAARTLSETLNFNPFYVPALNALGIVYLVDGKISQAALTHSWAAFLQPKNEIAYYNLSLAMERLASPDPAIFTAQTAAALEPSNPHPLVALALGYWSRGDRPAAQQAFQQAISLNPGLRDPDFRALDLEHAGFSLEQIQTVNQIATGENAPRS